MAGRGDKLTGRGSTFGCQMGRFHTSAHNTFSTTEGESVYLQSDDYTKILKDTKNKLFSVCCRSIAHRNMCLMCGRHIYSWNISKWDHFWRRWFIEPTWKMDSRGEQVRGVSRPLTLTLLDDAALCELLHLVSKTWTSVWLDNVQLWRRRRRRYCR